jgi:hypothetical protein
MSFNLNYRFIDLYYQISIVSEKSTNEIRNARATFDFLPLTYMKKKDQNNSTTSNFLMVVVNITTTKIVKEKETTHCR